jgi:AP-1 complex subunit mu
MTSAVFFLDLKGKTLLARNYRGDIPMSAVEKFMPLLLDAEEENAASPPCISHEGVNVLLLSRDPSMVYLLMLVSLHTT